MGSFGEHLRREREMRGVSLDEISASTKISRRLLAALEAEQFDLLPGGIFNKSYVRAYAKCIGIDEDAAVAEYLDASQETAPDTRLIAQQHASMHSERRPERSGFPVLPVLVLLVVAAGGVGGWKLYQQRRARHQEQDVPAAAQNSTAAPAAAVSETSTSPSAPVANTPQSATQTSVMQPPEKTAAGHNVAAPSPAANQGAEGAIEITVRPKGPAWVSIKSDGRFVVRGIIRPPDVRTIRASNEVVFYTGNAGAVELAFDGKSVPLEGGANQPQTLVFGSHGVLPRATAQ